MHTLQWIRRLTPRERLRRRIEQREPLGHTGDGMVKAIRDGMCDSSGREAIRSKGK